MKRLCSLCGKKISTYTNATGICRNCKIKENHKDWPRCIDCNKEFNYVPDFLIEYRSGRIILEEVKGYIPNKRKFEAKCKAAEEYCRKMKYEYVVNFMD